MIDRSLSTLQPNRFVPVHLTFCWTFSMFQPEMNSCVTRRSWDRHYEHGRGCGDDKNWSDYCFRTPWSCRTSMFQPLQTRSATLLSYSHQQLVKYCENIPSGKVHMYESRSMGNISSHSLIQNAKKLGKTETFENQAQLKFKVLFFTVQCCNQGFRSREIPVGKLPGNGKYLFPLPCNNP